MTDSVVRRLRRDDNLRDVQMTKHDAAKGGCQPGPDTSAYDLDHVVILVDDLECAVKDYRLLGFTVTPPQTVESSGVKRSCIFFADTSRTHLELISPRSGLATGAFTGLSTGAFYGLRFGFTRLRRDALARRTLTRATRWKVGAETGDSSPIRTNVLDGIWFRRRYHPKDGASATGAALPQSRSAHRGLSQHANGAAGIATVTVAVKSLEREVASYSARLGTQPFHWLGSPLLGVRTASFALGNTTFKLAQPTGEGAVNDYLKAHGEGPCALSFQTTTRTRRLDDARTHGLRLELVGDDAPITELPGH